MHIMLLEDDPEISDWISKGLSKSGHVVDAFDDGRDALIAATTRDYDLLILDRMVPELDGLSVVRTLRASHIETPALLLTALADVESRVEGLEAGADDYLPKPFAFSELQARVMALGRRKGRSVVQQTTKLQQGGLVLDLLTQKCTRDGATIDLNPKEMRLLEALLRNKGRVVTRTMLLENVWDINFDPSSSVVETHISRLRAKVDRPFATQLIHTVRGAGYRVGD